MRFRRRKKGEPEAGLFCLEWGAVPARKPGETLPKFYLHIIVKRACMALGLRGGLV